MRKPLTPPVSDTLLAYPLAVLLLLSSFAIFLITRLYVKDSNSTIYVFEFVLLILSPLIIFPIMSYRHHNSESYKVFQGEINVFLRHAYGINLTAEQLLQLSIRNEKYREYENSFENIVVRNINAHTFSRDEPYLSKPIDIEIASHTSYGTQTIITSCYLYVNPTRRKAFLRVMGTNQSIPFPDPAETGNF